MTFCCQVFLNTFVYQCYKLVSFVSFSIGRRFSSFWCYSWLILSSFLRYYDLQDNPHSYLYSFQVQAKKFAISGANTKKTNPSLCPFGCPSTIRTLKKKMWGGLNGLLWGLGGFFGFADESSDGEDGYDVFDLEAQVWVWGGSHGGDGLDQAPPHPHRRLLSFFASPTPAAADGSYDQQTGPGTGPTAGTATNILSRTTTEEGGASDSASPDGTSAPGGEDQMSTVRFAGGAGSGARPTTTRPTTEQLRWVCERAELICRLRFILICRRTRF